MNISSLLNRAIILDSLTSTSIKDGLSANRGKELSDGLANKLDTSSYNEYFKGVYLTFNALTSANPTATSGSYALVDAGIGTEADFYWYDADDGWVTSGGMVLANTDVLVEGSTNLYFTDARVRSSLLTGLAAGTNTSITSANSLLTALANLQAQISSLTSTDNVSEGSTNLYFTTARVRSSLLTGLTAGTNTAILSSDTLLVALAKLQAQIPNLASYATTSYVTTGLSANLDPTINTQSGTTYTVGTVGTDNNGKTYLRMTNAGANTVTITSALTKPISISQRGTGTTTLAGSGVTLNGTLAFSAQNQTKTIIPIGGSEYDIIG